MHSISWNHTALEQAKAQGVNQQSEGRIFETAEPSSWARSGRKPVQPA
jgi:hypothetical protein